MPVEILVRGKDAAENTKQFERCLDLIRTTGKKVGVITKDNQAGPFVTEWKNAFAEISKEVEEVDIAPALSAAMSVKDEKELVRENPVRYAIPTDWDTARNPRRLQSLKWHHGELLRRYHVRHPRRGEKDVSQAAVG